MSAEAGRRIARVLDALARERTLLIEGRFDVLEEAVERREALAARLDAAPPEGLRPHKAALEALREGAARNAALLRAALDGAAAGRRRVAEITAARGALSTYDASGAPATRAGGRAGGRRV